MADPVSDSDSAGSSGEVEVEEIKTTGKKKKNKNKTAVEEEVNLDDIDEWVHKNYFTTFGLMKEEQQKLATVRASAPFAQSSPSLPSRAQRSCRTQACSWKIYVKSGIVTWETQHTDYPRTRPDLPNHEPRGCARGASYSWYLYSANRVKNPLIRGKLMKVWRKMRETKSPIEAWTAIQADPILRQGYVETRGKGGFVRATWEEATEIVAAANSYTAKTYGPDRIFGFSPILSPTVVPGLFSVDIGGGLNGILLVATPTVPAQAWTQVHVDATGFTLGGTAWFQAAVFEVQTLAFPLVSTNVVSGTVVP